jgi:hypothetical protein
VGSCQGSCWLHLEGSDKWLPVDMSPDVETSLPPPQHLQKSKCRFYQLPFQPGLPDGTYIFKPKNPIWVNLIAFIFFDQIMCLYSECF